MKLAVLMVLLLFAVSGLAIHRRGHVRHRALRQAFDHSIVMAPINAFIYLLSAVPSVPYHDIRRFPELRRLAEQWHAIAAEGRRLMELEKIKAAEKNNDAGFNSFFKSGWKRFYLKWYDEAHPSAARLCPVTTALLRDMPSVKAAMFAMLPDGAVLNPHRDPYAGSLRLHLGLATPNDDRCFIEVDGQRYSWRDGEPVIFDETFIHWAENQSGRDRLILFCDIERPMRWRWAQAVNRWIGRTLVAAGSSPNEAGDRTGFINRIFIVSFVMGKYRRRFKQWNPAVYRATKAGLIVGVLVGLAAWIFAG
jgi:beta-hydroxylase